MSHLMARRSIYASLVSCVGDPPAGRFTCRVHATAPSPGRLTSRDRPRRRGLVFDAVADAHVGLLAFSHEVARGPETAGRLAVGFRCHGVRKRPDLLATRSQVRCGAALTLAQCRHTRAGRWPNSLLSG